MTLPPGINKIVNMRIVRVAAAGGLGVLAQTIVFEILGVWLGLIRPSTAVLIGAEFGIIINFVLSNRFAFGDRRHTPLWMRLARFHIVIMGALVIQWLCVYLTETVTSNWFAIHAAYVTGLLISFVYNYTGYRLWVWKNPPPTV